MGANAVRSLYIEVCDEIRHRIQNGELCAHDRLPAMKILSEEFKVSNITIRRAISELVNEGFLYARQGSGTYVADRKTSNESWPGSNRVRDLALLGMKIFRRKGSPSSLHRMTGGIEDACRQKGIRLHHFDIPDVARFDDLLIEIDRCDVQGAILYELANAAHIRRIAAAVPTVMLDYAIEGSDVDAVVVNNVPFAYQLTRHLIEIGHRRIAFVGSYRHENANKTPSVDPDSFERLAGFRMAMEEHGLKVDEDLVFSNRKGVAETALKILNADPKPTAVFCFGRSIALGLKDELQLNGLAIPGDMSLCCFNSDPACMEGHPELTSVYVDTRRMGSVAVDCLCEHIGRGTPRGIKMAVSGQFVLGRSTAPPAVERKFA